MMTRQQIESIAANADQQQDIDEIVGVANGTIEATPAARRWAINFRNSAGLMTLWFGIQAQERN